MKKVIKKILPKSAFTFLRRTFYPPSIEYRWLIMTKEKLKGRIRKDLIITKQGEFFLRSDFGFDFLVDITDPYLKLDTFDDDNFKILLKFLATKLPSNSVILDVGAFRGGYSLAVSSYFPISKIYCFEPIKKSYDKLVINIARNKKEAQIFPYCSAISENECEIYMTNNLSTGNHIISEKSIISSQIEKIPATTLDSFIIKNHIENVHFIKCDVEGYELAVVTGANSLIQNFKPIIYMEIQKEWAIRYGYKPVDLISKMRNFGYRVYVIENSSIEEVTDIEKAISENENFLFQVN